MLLFYCSIIFLSNIILNYSTFSPKTPSILDHKPSSLQNSSIDYMHYFMQQNVEELNAEFLALA